MEDIKKFEDFIDRMQGLLDNAKKQVHIIVRVEDLENAFPELAEQKPTDKVEPKFKVGDFIVNDYCMGKVIELTNDAYLFDTGQGIPFSHEHNAHLWTIQDAKDGDVLVASDSSIFLFKSTVDFGCKHYVALTTDGAVKFNEGLKHFWETSRAVHPATKEQRDLLFQKMHKAGYEWDEEKKELKKINQKPVFEMKTPEESLGIDSETYNKIVDECVYDEQKPAAWSEEDEELYNDLSDTYFYNDEDYPEETYKRMLKRVLDWMNKRAKSLRPQSTWKPSDEQMKALKEACDEHWEPDGLDPLYTLYQDLKKLMEE